MVAICESPVKTVRRHRHRSYRRKVVESFALVFGMPVVLFAVLAMSVELIEYKPIGQSAPREVSLSMADLDSYASPYR